MCRWWQRYLCLAFDSHRSHPFHLLPLLHRDCPSPRYHRFQLKKGKQNHLLMPSALLNKIEMWIKYLRRRCLDRGRQAALYQTAINPLQSVESISAKTINRINEYNDIQRRSLWQFTWMSLTHATCSFSISRNSDSSSHGVSASIQMLLPTVGRSDGKNGIIDIVWILLRFD